jgi:hypothetical protein
VKTQNVAVVSIHPDPATPIALDIKDILAALGSHLPQWTWCVRDLDWLGENADALCRTVEASTPNGHWLASEDLLSQARHVYQTIEGEFLAFPRGVEPNEVKVQDLNLGTFPESKAELAIVAVDGCYFDVYVKDPEMLTSLRELGDVRDEDTKMYF